MTFAAENLFSFGKQTCFHLPSNATLRRINIVFMSKFFRMLGFDEKTKTNMKPVLDTNANTLAQD